jgi:hypothetical protein
MDFVHNKPIEHLLLVQGGKSLLELFVNG